MTNTNSKQWSIRDVARRTGVTERALRYYEDLGLLAPARDTGGRRRYDSGSLDRLYQVRLLRELGTPLPDVDPDADDLRALTRRHRADLDARLTDLARLRERVRAVEDRLLHGNPPSDEAHHARVAATGAAIEYEPSDICPTGCANTACVTQRATSGHSRHH